MTRYILQGETQDGKTLEIPIIAAYDENGNKFTEYYAQRPEYEEVITNLSALSAKLLAPHTYRLSITQGGNTTITVRRKSSQIQNVAMGILSNGDPIYRCDVLEISATASDGYKVSITVDDKEWTSGDTLMVMGAVTVATTAELQPYAIYTSVSGGSATFTFNRTSSPLKNAATGTISQNGTIYYGDVITISVAADEGYSISALTVNGEAWTSGKSITVSGSIRVKAEAYCKNYQFSISQGDNTKISVNRTSSPLEGTYTGVMMDGEPVYYGDVLTISAVTDDGYELSTFAVNGNAWTSGNSITVSEAVAVVTKAEVKSYALSISQGANTTISATRTSSPLKNAATGTMSNGSTIYYGDVLTFSATANTGYSMSTFTVNGNAWTSGNSITVSEAVAVVAKAEAPHWRTVWSGSQSVVADTITTIAIALTDSDNVKYYPGHDTNTIFYALEDASYQTRVTYYVESTMGVTVQSSKTVTVSGSTVLYSTGSGTTYKDTSVEISGRDLKFGTEVRSSEAKKKVSMIWKVIVTKVEQYY